MTSSSGLACGDIWRGWEQSNCITKSILILISYCNYKEEIDLSKKIILTYRPTGANIKIGLHNPDRQGGDPSFPFRERKVTHTVISDLVIGQDVAPVAPPFQSTEHIPFLAIFVLTTNSSFASCHI